MDLYYLEDQDLARQLVELGYRGSGETLKREEFEARKKAAEEAKASKCVDPRMCSKQHWIFGPTRCASTMGLITPM